MIDCERCGQRGVTLPCPGCGWEGEPVAVENKAPRRSVPLLAASLVAIVAGALLTCPAWSFGARGLVLLAAGVPLAAAPWFIGAGLTVGAGLGLLLVGRRLLRRSTE